MCELALGKKEKRKTYDENILNTNSISDEPKYSGANGSVVIYIYWIQTI